MDNESFCCISSVCSYHLSFCSYDRTSFQNNTRYFFYEPVPISTTVGEKYVTWYVTSYGRIMSHDMGKICAIICDIYCPLLYQRRADKVILTFTVRIQAGCPEGCNTLWQNILNTLEFRCILLQPYGEKT